MDPSALTAAQLQEELTKRGLDVKWQPLKGKKVLVERLQVCTQKLNPQTGMGHHKQTFAHTDMHTQS